MIYLVWSAVAAVVYVLVIEFLRGVDSGGFDPQRTPLYRLISDVLAGGLGYSFVERLFSEGPYVFAHTVGFTLVVVYLSFSSVVRFAVERQAGVVDLIAFGPADATSCLLGGLEKDLALSAVSAVLLLAFEWLLARTHNLVLGPRLVRLVLSLYCMGIGVYGVGMLATAASRHPAGAAALFAALLASFAALRVGTYAATDRYVHALSAAISAMGRWLSPLYYWDLSMRSAEAGRLGMYWTANALQLLLCLGAIAISHRLLRPAGSRS